MIRQPESPKTFVWRICSAHVIAYFTAGVFALLFLDYRTHFSSESLALLMRPVSSPWVALGPGLQIFRGVLIALALLPVRGFLYGKNGFLKLAWLVLGLSFISTIGPTPGSFDGYIYTILPVQYHLGGIPEAVLYTVLFAGILAFWHKSGKRYVTVLSIVLVAVIVLFSVMGFLGAAQAE
ncbi:hypothetical protein [Alistipes finegoldii]|uniref:hypothetical protein n=1 Tax=Alistipes finegoldii TaxID=214856 RepID=UPI003AB16712